MVVIPDRGSGRAQVIHALMWWVESDRRPVQVVRIPPDSPVATCHRAAGRRATAPPALHVVLPAVVVVAGPRYRTPSRGATIRFAGRPPEQRLTSQLEGACPISSSPTSTRARGASSSRW